MEFGKATLLEVNDERNVHKNVWQFVLFHFGFSRGTPETGHLRSSLAESERQRLQAEGNLRASLAENRSLRQQRGYLTLAVGAYMIPYHTGLAFLFALFMLVAVHRKQLWKLVEDLRLSEVLDSVARRVSRETLPTIARLRQRIRARIRSWKSSANVSRSFGTSL